jgi:HK97 gp10 family phage protein
MTTIQVQGISETIQYLNGVFQQLSNMQRGMQKATLVVTRSAKQNSPVDIGLLRASITPSVSSSGNTTTGVVGSNVKYAPFMELGTRPHWPPLAALEVWARRHGTTAYVVARAIARRGLKARRYLGRALEDNTRKIIKIFRDEVRRIIG